MPTQHCLNFCSTKIVIVQTSKFSKNHGGEISDARRREKIGCREVRGRGKGRLTAPFPFLPTSLKYPSWIFTSSIAKHEISGFRGVENMDCSLYFYVCLLNDDASIFVYRASNKDVQRTRSWPLLTYLTLRLLMSYIYMEHLFLMFLDHTQRRSTVGRTPLDE